ncbi:MAG: hypothetical protein MJ145_02660 [Clostridia bacterium]|nr:hypothetical protein [Clostridia bacterium]
MEKQGKKTIRFWGIWAVLVAGLCFVVYAIPSITGAFTSTYVTNYGDLVISDDAKGYIVRTEKVYVSKKSGAVNKLIDQGTLVKKNTRIIELSKSSKKTKAREDLMIAVRRITNDKYIIKTKSFKTRKAGVVSYYVDGLEDKFTFTKIRKMSADSAEAYSQNQVIEIPADVCVKGEPIFKLIDNSKWYIVCYLDRLDAKKYERGKQVSINIGKTELRAKVVYNKKENKGKKYTVIFSTQDYYEKFDSIRSCDVQIVYSDTKGLIIENDSIVKEKGVEGVYVIDKAGNSVFKPINVLASDGERTVVSRSVFYDKDGQAVETLNTYDEIKR